MVDEGLPDATRLEWRTAVGPVGLAALAQLGNHSEPSVRAAEPSSNLSVLATNATIEMSDGKANEYYRQGLGALDSQLYDSAVDWFSRVS